MIEDYTLFEQATYSFAASQENQFDVAARILIAGFEILNNAAQDSETYDMLVEYFFQIAANIPNKNVH